MRRWLMMWVVVLGAVGAWGALATSAAAQGEGAKKKVASEADLPRFSYPVQGTASGLLLADDATFGTFAQKVGADVDSVLTGYEIADKATLRGLLATRANVQLLQGDDAGMLATLDKVRELQEKADAKSTSGLLARAVLTARRKAGATSGPAYDQAFATALTDELAPLQWATVQDRMKAMKGSYQLISSDLIVGNTKERVDSAVLKSGTIDFATAQGLVSDRITLKFMLPLKQEIVADLTTYVKAHNVQKADIWAAREVTLTDAQKLTPVRIGIWDSGVDTALYPKQLFTDPKPGAHSAHGLAYDEQGKLYAGDLQPLTAEQKASYPKVLSVEEGISDLQSNIDSSQAASARKFLSETPSDQIASFFKQMGFLGQYMHGTHVAGIAVRGNPAARLVVVQFNDGLPDLPFAPTVEWAERFKADFKQVGEYFRDNDVRVVNMSWGDSQGEIEEWLTKTSTEKDPAVRKQFAAEIYGIWREAVEDAIKSAPKTLFVCAAGNSNSNAGFLGDVPASLKLPNLITVGAVDQAGEETSFTSYGDTVVLHGDGFQVKSYVPGGTMIALSGTSMASPNVVNLAAKLIALDPKLTPEETIALMKKGAENSADGRRHLIDPKRTVALLEQGGM